MVEAKRLAAQPNAYRSLTLQKVYWSNQWSQPWFPTWLLACTPSFYLLILPHTTHSQVRENVNDTALDPDTGPLFYPSELWKAQLQSWIMSKKNIMSRLIPNFSRAKFELVWSCFKKKNEVGKNLSPSCRGLPPTCSVASSLCCPSQWHSQVICLYLGSKKILLLPYQQQNQI